MKNFFFLSGITVLKAVSTFLLVSLVICGHAQAQDESEEPLASETIEEPLASETIEETPKDVDPWQGFNRKVFAFNEVMDKYLLRPAAVGYKFIMPDPLEKGVTNIFDNVLEVPSVINNLLQANAGGAAHDTGRILVNTTLGLGGLLDVAKHMNLPADDHEDFGQTLAVWGVGSGPYLVLPFIGPSNVRDGIGRPVDWYLDPTTYIEHVPTVNTVKGVSILSTRANLISLEENITGDKYTFLRDVYLQRRAYLIKNGEVEDGFGAEDDFDMEEF